jgi:hypothetical protein
VSASVSGGRDSQASGDQSSVGGGLSRSTLTGFDWVAGSLFEQN